MKKIVVLSIVFIMLFASFSFATENEKAEENDIIESETVESKNKEGIENNIESKNEDEIGADNTVKLGDFTNAKVEIIPSESSQFRNFDAIVNNATLIEDNRYYLYISHKDEKITQIDYNDIKADMATHDKYLLIGSDRKTRINKYIEEAGDLYYTLIEVYYDGTDYTNKAKVVKTGKMERPLQNPIGERIKCYFFNDRTSTFLYEINSDKENRKLNIKVGKVKNNTILLDIKDEKNGALSRLMDYAKKDSTPLYTATISLGVSDTITSKFDFVNKEYYYVYAEMEDENGKYYPIEDVSLYQALIGKDIGKNLFDYLDDNFKWNSSITPQNEGDEYDVPTNTPTNNIRNNLTNDPTIATERLPYTGKIAITGAIVIAGAISLILFIKNKKLEDI